MYILAIDTSADDTACAISLDDKLLANIRSSQIDFHKEWGGIVPSIARKSHEENIGPIIETALKRAKINQEAIDAIAVTKGPGLAIALEVGIEKAKELAKGKKMIAVNHIAGHIYANFARNSKGNPKRELTFPLLCLIVSGGHTELVLMKEHHNFQKIGRTRDDAAGEAFDKVGRMLGFGYPAGPVIERIAEEGDPHRFSFPRPMEKFDTLDFSFSGLKTAVMYQIKELGGLESLEKRTIADLASSFQQAVIDSLLIKTKKVVRDYGIQQLVLGGGVIANMTLRRAFRRELKKLNVKVFVPPLPDLCTDNAGMIAIAGYYQAKQGGFVENYEDLDRDPLLSL